MEEKQAFRERLLSALKDAGVAITSPTRIALQFNLLHHGKPVTAQAVRKWLAGQAIPSQEKLLTLAKWLNISASSLRFGSDGPTEGAATFSQRAELELALDIVKLNAEHQLVVKSVIATLLRIECSRQVD
jgi:transcriptional regulator with XRE-family HTH domain